MKITVEFETAEEFQGLEDINRVTARIMSVLPNKPTVICKVNAFLNGCFNSPDGPVYGNVMMVFKPKKNLG